MALNKPEPEYKLPPPVSLPTVAPPPAPARPAPAGDMASYIEARRRARGTPEESLAAPPATEDENARRNRIVAANITPQNTMTFGYVPKNGGGVFQVERMGFNDAEFIFFGWNKDIRRRAMQRIEVQRGSNPDIRIAIVRKMIEVIRITEQGDFQWDSVRLGRTLTLSARVADTAGLEEFMLHEFFDDPRRGR